MNIRNTVREELERLAPGSIVTYKDFAVPSASLPTLVKALSTFYRQGMLGKITKGLYYKPRPSEFGPLKPSTTLLLDYLLKEQKQAIAYLTGTNTYNALRLTTQLSTEYVIATDRPRTAIKIEGTTIRFVQARLKNAPSLPFLAQLLDAMQNIKDIPDTSSTLAALVFLGHIKQLESEKRQELVEMALAYSPATRVLLGILFEQLGEKFLAKKLQRTLNPISTYKLHLDFSKFPTSLRWNIA